MAGSSSWRFAIPARTSERVLSEPDLRCQVVKVKVPVSVSKQPVGRCGCILGAKFRRAAFRENLVLQKYDEHTEESQSPSAFHGDSGRRVGGDKMGKLIRYLDGKTGCWSRVNLENGDPIWISVAQTGVIVKKSRMGLMGAKLYNETNVYNAAKTAQALDAQISEYVTPSEITNPVLRALTQVALEFKSAAQLSVCLNKALQDEGTSDLISVENRKKAKIREQIISEYGSYIENHPPVGEIRDVSELPYPKEEILDAITLEIVREYNDERVEAMKACAIMLADFQENVGSKPLTMLGINTSEMLAGVTSNDSDLKNLAAKLAENPDKEKYESLRKVADEELVNIQSKLMAAEELRRQMPEAKKRQILG